MPYQQNIPQSTDLLSQSQGDILGNFQAIKTLVDVNHVTFDTVNEGKHFKVSLPVQSPAPTFDVGEVGMYSFLSPITSKNELYINKLNQITTKQIPATASILSVTSAPGDNTAGWSYLPSGVLIKWGHSTANGLTATNFPVAGNIPVFTNVFTIMITTAYGNAADGDGFCRLQNFNATQFFVYGSARTTVSDKAVNFQYLAIGV